MSSANKPHKVLAQAQKTIRKFGWVKGSWFVQNAGVCLEGAVGIRGNNQRTRTPVRMEACAYIQRAADEILRLDSLRDIAIPQINDAVLKEEEQALEILELAEQMAYKDYLAKLESEAFEGVEIEEDDEIDLDFSTFIAQQNS